MCHPIPSVRYGLAVYRPLSIVTIKQPPSRRVPLIGRGPKREPSEPIRT
jgi:hypothetical protein